MIRRLQRWWYDHHCLICGRWDFHGRGVHWPCERKLLPND